MFENIGGKMKTLARSIFVRGCIGSLLSAIIAAMQVGFLMFFVVLIFGGIASYFSSMFLYAFGQLVENSDNVQSKLFNLGVKLNNLDKQLTALTQQDNEQPSVTMSNIPSQQRSPQSPSATDKEGKRGSCSKCHQSQYAGGAICWKCGASLTDGITTKLNTSNTSKPSTNVYPTDNPEMMACPRCGEFQRNDRVICFYGGEKLH